VTLFDLFDRYIPAQQARDYAELRDAAVDFYASRGLLNPRDMEVSLIVVEFMLRHPRPGVW